MTEFVLVRHGETVWNDEARYQGHADVPLSERGRRQAAATGERLAGTPLDAAYSSDLQRCLETARLILRGRDVPLAPRNALRESNHGLWEGLTFQEVEERYAADLRRRMADPVRCAATGGETLGSVQERAWAVVEEIVGRHAGGRVLLVSHNGTIRTIVCRVLGLALAYGWRLGLRNAGITIVRMEPGGPASLLLLNDVCHLKGQG